MYGTGDPSISDLAEVFSVSRSRVGSIKISGVKFTRIDG